MRTEQRRAREPTASGRDSVEGETIDIMRVEGAVALVTGASSGIGRVTADLLAQRGARVLRHRRSSAATDAAVDRSTGAMLGEDLAEPGAAPRLAGAAGEVDILVANAGVGYAGDLSTMDEDVITRLIQVNLTAPIELTRALLPGMLRRDAGAIVFVTSIAGRMGVAGEAVYAATKAGLAAFAESLRLELRGTGITVGEVVPGVVDTAFFERRGRAYGRARPRPLPAATVAQSIVDVIESGRAEAYRPSWLRLPVAVRALAPDTYRYLAARFGGS